MPQIDSNEQAIALQALIAALLAILCDWLPGVRNWWLPLEETQKRLYMGVFLLVSTVGVSLTDCYLYGNCPANWGERFFEMAALYLSGVAVNQATYSLAKNAR